LVYDDTDIKDWVGDAKKILPTPLLSLPYTAPVEIHLVEPTPVPSRVGSLGGTPRPIPEDRKKNKFFIQSSPNKSGSDTSERPKSSSDSKKSKRTVSVSNIKGKFAAEKRKAAAALVRPESDWEDEDEPEEEAQREREMFAKQQIFGSKPSEGLLTGMFKRGGSMVDLGVQTVQPLSRSKSVAAMPMVSCPTT
jgi:hypothetical protein